MNKVGKTVQSINKIFNAKSVAVFGASSNPNKRGYMVYTVGDCKTQRLIRETIEERLRTVYKI